MIGGVGRGMWGWLRSEAIGVKGTNIPLFVTLTFNLTCVCVFVFVCVCLT